MRYAELVFLTILVLYHVVLLVPRRRRLFPANYLIFLAGMALAWNLGLEGLRWQTLPPLLLLLVDLAVLFPTFATLRGKAPSPGLLSGLGRVVRTAIAWVALMVAVGSAILSVAFPLPRVELTGGLTPGHRIVRFAPVGDKPGFQLRLWYPAAGSQRALPRPISQPETWQRLRAQGGLPVFWQSYLEHLPTASILGGRLVGKTRHPVVFAVVPPGQDPIDFGYLFEDLASRGFIVAAGGPLPPPVQPDAFDWSTVWTEMSRPFDGPRLWIEPEATLAGEGAGPSYQWVPLGQEALHQLDSEPGDPFYEALDWSRQALWVWGQGQGLPGATLKAWGLRGTIQVGRLPGASEPSPVPELWIGAGAAPAKYGTPDQWVLTLPQLQRTDLSDSAYLKPYLFFFGLKSQPDAGLHGAVRQYQAAFYQHLFWSDSEQAFGQTVPTIPGLVLTGR